MTDPAKPKRSLFKRPTWAASTAPVAAGASPTRGTDTKPDPPTDLFSRSHNYTEFVEDRERQRRKKKEKDVRRKSNTDDARDDDDHSSNVKRRRISNEDGHDFPVKPKVKESKMGSNAATDRDSFDSAPEPQKRRPRETVIELLDDDDEEEEDYTKTGVQSIGATTPVETPAPEPDPDADLDEMYASDPEMLAIVRKARQKRRQEELGVNDGPDPVVKLLITSPIPNTTPLIVSRKMSQRLQEVREAWLSKQTLSPHVARSIFFTYKLRRVYDVTTCKSLGVKIDPYGRVTSDQPFALGEEHAEKIHIEAMDTETWQKAKADKAAPKPNPYLNAGNTVNAGGSTEGTPAVDDENAAPEPLIKITLKAKGYDDIKIKVRPTTTFAKMIGAARSQFRLNAEQEVFLEFDGDKLEPLDGQVKDIEIEDMDCIDVHIK